MLLRERQVQKGLVLPGKPYVPSRSALHLRAAKSLLTDVSALEKCVLGWVPLRTGEPHRIPYPSAILPTKTHPGRQQMTALSLATLGCDLRSIPGSWLGLTVVAIWRVNQRRAVVSVCVTLK